MLKWMQEDDWERTETLREIGLHNQTGWQGRYGSVRRHLTAERAAAAGLDASLYFDANGDKLEYKSICARSVARRSDGKVVQVVHERSMNGASASHRLSKAVRRAERAREDPEQAKLDRAADAQRKRVRRIEDGKEDQDALRELSRSRDDGTVLALESTPDGLRETATDGTPRSAKAAAAKLRKLTQSLYERLMDPRFYDVTSEELKAVRVRTEFWDASHPTRQGWETGTRPLKRFGGKARVDTESDCTHFVLFIWDLGKAGGAPVRLFIITLQGTSEHTFEGPLHRSRPLPHSGHGTSASSNTHDPPGSTVRVPTAELGWVDSSFCFGRRRIGGWGPAGAAPRWRRRPRP
jgi:hypothetical protein